MLYMWVVEPSIHPVPRQREHDAIFFSFALHPLHVAVPFAARMVVAAALSCPTRIASLSFFKCGLPSAPALSPMDFSSLANDSSEELAVFIRSSTVGGDFSSSLIEATAAFTVSASPLAITLATSICSDFGSS